MSCKCYAKRRFSWHQSIQAFFLCDTHHRIVICCFYRLNSVVGVVPKEGLVGLMPAEPSFGILVTSFGMKIIQILRLILAWHGSMYLLKVVVSGVASTPDEVQLYTSCTLLAAEAEGDQAGAIESCIGFLNDSEFITLRTIRQNGKTFSIRFTNYLPCQWPSS